MNKVADEATASMGRTDDGSVKAGDAQGGAAKSFLQFHYDATTFDVWALGIAIVIGGNPQ
jgi:hypothetical protein